MESRQCLNPSLLVFQAAALCKRSTYLSFLPSQSLPALGDMSRVTLRGCPLSPQVTEQMAAAADKQSPLLDPPLWGFGNSPGCVVKRARPHAQNGPDVDEAAVIFCQCSLARKEQLENK